MRNLREIESRVILRLLSVTFPELRMEDEDFSNSSKLFPNELRFHDVHFLIGEIIPGNVGADLI
jgi:hypothetical protein